MVILNSGGNYLKVENVTEGDLITFKDEGTWIESKYTYPDGNNKQDFVMKIDYKGEEYSARIGKFSRDELVPVYGSDTSKWIGKNAKITIETYRSLNKKGIIFLPVNGDKSESQQSTKEAWDSD